MADEENSSSGESSGESGSSSSEEEVKKEEIELKDVSEKKEEPVEFEQPIAKEETQKKCKRGGNCHLTYVVILGFVILGAIVVLGLILTGVNFGVNMSMLTKSNSNKEKVDKIFADLGLGLGASIHQKLPQLIVHLTVDQLRGDLVMKFRKNFGDNGFNRLFAKGMYFRNAHYNHITTFTALDTRNTATHGILSNEWYDLETGEEIGVVEDHHHGEVDEIDTLEGSSPSRMESTTYGDELRLFSNASKVFSISIKDRASILPGGHLGKAFWYSLPTGRMISSTYYYDEYPAYVNEFNSPSDSSTSFVDSFKEKDWELEYPLSKYHYQENTYSKPHIDKDFPRSFDSDNFYKNLRETPAGDMILSEFAQKLVAAENLGKNGVVDMLAVSFSCTDYITHYNGDSSLAAEDNIYKIDKTIGGLMDFLDDYIGLDNVLLVLSADHGRDVEMARMLDLGYEAGQMSGSLVDEINAYLDQEIGRDDLVLAHYHPNVWLNETAVKQVSTVEEVCEMVISYLMTLPEIAFAVSRADILKGHYPRNPLAEKIGVSFHPKRSGHVLYLNKMNYMAKSSSKVTQHGTHYSYDTYVPLFFMGRDIRNGIVDRRVHPEDIASTVTTYYNLKQPNGNIGVPLMEVLQRHEVNSEL